LPDYFLAAPMTRTFLRDRCPHADLGPAGRTRTDLRALATITPLFAGNGYFLAEPTTRTFFRD